MQLNAKLQKNMSNGFSNGAFTPDEKDRSPSGRNSFRQREASGNSLDTPPPSNNGTIGPGNGLSETSFIQ
jgi:hypothetical protein